jgi:hypothetical protein
VSGRSWVLIDDSGGAKTTSGESLTPAALAHIVEAVQLQLDGEVHDEYGQQTALRVGSSATDIRDGESVYAFVATFPDEPDASAYHDVEGKGVPCSFCAITTCDTLLGLGSSVSVDASHELCEAHEDEGCNQEADDGSGRMHARELCDPVEVQSYVKTCADGTQVGVSNFVLRSWFIPGAVAPFDFMSAAGLIGAVAPPAPMTIAAGAGGNYDIENPSTTSQETQVMARGTKAPPHIVGTRRKGAPHWSSRAYRRGVRP